MKRALFSGILAVLVTVGVMAQAKPDFSGTWTLDTEKSTMVVETVHQQPGRAGHDEAGL